MKKYFFIILIMCSIILAGCAASNSVKSFADEADDLHKKIITIDTHTDAPLRLLQKDFDIRKLHDAREDQSKVDFPRMKKGGLDAVFFAAFVAQGVRTDSGNEAAKQKVIRIIDTIHSVISRNRDISSLALSSSDAGKIKAEGKSAVYIGIENGYAIGNDIELIKTFYGMGVRYITLCHTRNNDICDSSTDPDTLMFNGLSKLGIKAVEAMNNTGMLIDVSHISDSAFYDVLKYSKVPVLASHSCARAICNNPRNLDDDMLKKLAENGGVIQVCILSDYVKTSPADHKRDSVFSAFRLKYSGYDNMTDEQRAIVRKERLELDKKYPKALATVSDVVDHIDHIVKVAGIDHVGIGTDFDGGGGVEGCYDASEMKNITIELLKRNYSHNEIAKIWGGNFLRVFRQAEQFAAANAAR